MKGTLVESLQTCTDLDPVMRVDVSTKISVTSILHQVFPAREACSLGAVFLPLPKKLASFLPVKDFMSFCHGYRRTRLVICVNWKIDGCKVSTRDYRLRNFQNLNGNIVRVTCPAYSCYEEEEK